MRGPGGQEFQGIRVSGVKGVYGVWGLEYVRCVNILIISTKLGFR